MQIKPTVVIILDGRHEKKSGRFPVKLRITFQKQQKYYPVGIDVTEEEFNLVQGNIGRFRDLPLKERRKLQEYKMKCEAITARANEILNRLPFFSFRHFEKKFLIGQHARDSVYLYYENMIAQLKQQARIGTASSYTTSMNCLKKYAPKLLLRDVTVEFLQKFEQWVLGRGRSVTTVGIYLRPLRAVLNQAIEEGEFLRDFYPFGKRRFQIPASRNIKKALSLEEIGRIVNFEAEPGTWFEKARDIFVFSYFGNGINIKDILHLKFSNIDGEYIRYTRAKTQRTNRINSSPITFHICGEIKCIINRYRTANNSSDGFIFPVLDDCMSPQKVMAHVQQYTKMVNKYLAKIALVIGLEKKVTTYFARHSFATVLKKSGISPLFISESLGHCSLKTTENYLASFDDESKKAVAELLRKFDERRI